MTPILQGIIRFCVTFRLRILKVSIRRSAWRRASSQIANRVPTSQSWPSPRPICPTADTHAAGLSSSEWRIYQFAADHVRYFLSARRSSLASLCIGVGVVPVPVNPTPFAEVKSPPKSKGGGLPNQPVAIGAPRNTKPSKPESRNPGSGPNKTLWIIAAATRKCHR